MMMRTICVVTLLLMIFTSSFTLEYCETDQGPDPERVWNYVPGPNEITCNNSPLHIFCCAANNKNVIWWKLDTRTQNWTPIQDRDKNVTITGPGHIHLILHHTPLVDNGTQYKCQIEGTNHQRKKKIIVRECDDGGNVEYVEPLTKHSQTAAVTGTNVTLTCRIVTSRSFNLLLDSINWYHVACNGSLHGLEAITNETITGDGKIIPPRLEPQLSPSGKYMRSELTIVNVQSADYDQCYACGTDGLSFRVLHLVLPGVDNPPLPVIVTPAVIISCLLLLSMMLYIFHLDVRLLFHPLTSQVPGKFKQSLCLINTDSTTDVRFIKAVLLKKVEDEMKLTIAVNIRDFLIDYRDECMYEAIRDSQRVMLVLSPDFLSHELCNRAFEYANVTKRGRNEIIFLVVGDLTSDLWQDHHIVLKQRLEHAGRFYSSVTKLVWRDEYESCDLPFNQTHDDARKSPFEIIKAWTVARQANNFWKRFRLSMPATHRTNFSCFGKMEKEDRDNVSLTLHM